VVIVIKIEKGKEISISRRHVLEACLLFDDNGHVRMFLNNSIL
jgi:hypothetical protein